MRVGALARSALVARRPVPVGLEGIAGQWTGVQVVADAHVAHCDDHQRDDEAQGDVAHVVQLGVVYFLLEYAHCAAICAYNLIVIKLIALCRSRKKCNIIVLFSAVSL